MKIRIKELREDLGLSENLFCRMCNLQVSQLKGWEDGAVPTIATIEKIANVFEVAPSWLVGWSEYKRPEDRVQRVCYVADGPSRIPACWDDMMTGHTIRWKQTKRPSIDKRDKLDDGNRVRGGRV